MVAPSGIMMNANDKELIGRIKNLKVKTVFENYNDDSYIKVSNYIKIIGNEHVVFIPQKDYKNHKYRKTDSDWKGNID